MILLFSEGEELISDNNSGSSSVGDEDVYKKSIELVLIVIRQVCRQTLARVRVSWT